MARPSKQGIDYFPLDVDLDCDDKLSMIIGEFGYKGEIIYTKLLAWIYKHNGYYLIWNETEQLKFAKRVAYIGGPSVSLINEIVARCIKWGLFDRSVFESLQVLTSTRIQMTWMDATRKRKDRQINQKIWLIGVVAALKAEETPEKAEVIDKVKESKVKKSNSKSHSGAIAPGKVDKGEPTKYWKILVSAWFDFYGRRFKNEDQSAAKPIFNKAQGDQLRKIVTHLQKIAEGSNRQWTEEYAEYCLRGFFQKAYDHDEWLRLNFELANMLSKFNSIINTSKETNGSNSKAHRTSINHRETGASKLADALAANLSIISAGRAEGFGG